MARAVNIKRRKECVAIMEKKKTVVTVTAIVVMIVLLCGIYAAVQAHEKNKLVVQGSLKMTESTLNSMLEGTIEEVLVSEGDEVKEGDVLVRMKSDIVDAKLQQAEGAQSAAQAQADMAAAGARNQEVAQAKAAYDYAQKMYDLSLIHICGQFDWGGRLLKSSGGVQRLARPGRKPGERVQTQKPA